MALERCRVSFTDTYSIPQAVHVHAESLYEAIALAVAAFREDRLCLRPASATEFTISIERPAVEHRIRLAQVEKWTEMTTREGPAGITKRQRVKALLSGA
jgi:hypothetical protein